MNEKVNNEDKGFYTDSDVEDMLKELEGIAESNYNSSNRIIHKLSHKMPDEISILELQNPEDIVRHNGNGSFFILIKELVNIINQIYRESKYQSQKSNKIHHDLIRIHNELINIDNSLQLSNLIKLYDDEVVSDRVLINELKKISDLFDNEKG